MRTISDKILKGRTYEIARNRIYDGYQSALARPGPNRTRSGCKWTNSWRIP